MVRTEDAANVAFPPPVAWAIAWIVGLVLCRLIPLPFLPGSALTAWIGAALFADLSEDERDELLEYLGI